MAPGGAGLAPGLGLFESSLKDERGFSDLERSRGGIPAVNPVGVAGKDGLLSCFNATAGG